MKVLFFIPFLLMGCEPIYDQTKYSKLSCINGQEFIRSGYGMANHLDDEGRPIKCSHTQVRTTDGN